MGRGREQEPGRRRGSGSVLGQGSGRPAEEIGVRWPAWVETRDEEEAAAATGRGGEKPRRAAAAAARRKKETLRL